MKLYDTAIIGKGPAGISAALYTVRAGMKTAIFGMSEGTLEKADKIENYYGLNEPVSGSELHEIGISQAKNIGAELFEDEIIEISFGNHFLIKTTVSEYESKTVILASGKPRKSVDIDGIKRLEGHGISYCAVCDGFFYKGKPVGVIGSGAYAGSEAAHLVRFASSVTVFTNGEEVQSGMPESVKIETAKIQKIVGENGVESVLLDDGRNVLVDGIFVAIGSASSSDFAIKMGVILENGNIKTDENQMTNVPGVFAAGDCTGGLMQIATAVGEGAVAGTAALKFLRLKK